MRAVALKGQKISERDRIICSARDRYQNDAYSITNLPVITPAAGAADAEGRAHPFRTTYGKLAKCVDREHAPRADATAAATKIFNDKQRIYRGYQTRSKRVRCVRRMVLKSRCFTHFTTIALESRETDMKLRKLPP